jgi:hypothetical protein
MDNGNIVAGTSSTSPQTRDGSVPNGCGRCAELEVLNADLEEGMAYFLMLSVRLGAELPGDVIAWAKSVLRGKTRPGYEVARAAIARLSGKED